jgi:quinol monooxygenase YgiN
LQHKLRTDIYSEKQTDYTCVATFLPLKSWKYMLSFQRLSSKVLKQIKEDEGAANYAVRANLLKKHFWTLSIWKDQNSLRRFIMTEPHATAVKKFTEWAGEGSAFVEWSSPENTIDWPEALRKLQNPTYYYKK